jgi:hypothetical protein
MSLNLPRFDGGGVEDKRPEASHKENKQGKNCHAIHDE